MEYLNLLRIFKKGDEPEQTIDVDALNETSKKYLMCFGCRNNNCGACRSSTRNKNNGSNSGRKSKIKELMVPYIVGCIVMFSAFTIWKVVVTIGNQSLDPWNLNTDTRWRW